MLNRLGSQVQNPYLLMDRAYEGNETRQLALALGFTPVVPPLSTRVHPWEYDREMYKRRNEIERLFRRLKGFRRIFSRGEARCDIPRVHLIRTPSICSANTVGCKEVRTLRPECTIATREMYKRRNEIERLFRRCTGLLQQSHIGIAVLVVQELPTGPFVLHVPKQNTHESSSVWDVIPG